MATMASTSPRKTPTPRKRAARNPAEAPAEPVAAPAVVAHEAPPPAAPVAAEAPDTAAPAPAPAPKPRAPRKRASPKTAAPAEPPAEAEAVAVTAVDPAPAVAPPPEAAEPPVAAPAPRPRRRKPKAAAAIDEAPAAPTPEPQAEAAEAPAPAVPEPAPEPVAEPAPPPEPQPEPQPEPEPEPVPSRPVPSHVALARGDRHRLAWTAGTDCPPAVEAAAQLLNQPTPEAPHAGDLALLDLVRLARQHRHPLQVDDDVWPWIAQARDMRDRVRVLEQAHPDGPSSAALSARLGLTLRPHQAEAALWAACAGRGLLDDDAGLGRTVEAIATLHLLDTVFGVERALVLCPASRVEAWRARWQAHGGASAALALTVAPLDALPGSAAELAALEAEAVIVDEDPADAEASPWDDPARREALDGLRGTWGLALARHRPAPARLAAMLDWVDTHRLGALDAARRTGEAAPDAAAIEPWCLGRRREEVLRQLPATVERTVETPRDPDGQAAHDADLAALRADVRRWRRTGYLADSTQHRLLGALHRIRLGCDDAAKIEAAAQAVAEAAGRCVVFSQWEAPLDRLAEALAARGLAAVRLPAGPGAGEARRAAVAAFQEGARALLCSDDGPGGHLGLHDPTLAVIHLDRPWNPAMLAQRHSRVHRGDRARQVPVTHLVAAGSLEARLVAAQADEALRERYAGLIDGPQAEVFLAGSRAERLMLAVEALVGEDAPAPQAVAAG